MNPPLGMTYCIVCGDETMGWGTEYNLCPDRRCAEQYAAVANVKFYADEGIDKLSRFRTSYARFVCPFCGPYQLIASKTDLLVAALAPDLVREREADFQKTAIDMIWQHMEKCERAHGSK